MQKRRESIINTAFRLFCDHGIDQVSLLQIAKKAKVCESSIYRYFSNKEQLVQETFLLLWDTVMRDVEKSVRSYPHYDDLTGYGQMKVLVESLRRFYQTDPTFVLFSYEAELYLLRQHTRLDQFQQDSLMYTFRRHCLSALDKGRADGSIPVKESSEDLFYAIWGSIRGYVVKIAVYGNLYGRDSPQDDKDKYKIMENEILSALSSGWNPPNDVQQRKEAML